MERFDRDALLRWLTERRASARLLERVRAWKQSPPSELLPGLPPLELADVYLVLCGMLTQTVEPYVREDRLDALKSQALVLGYREKDFESLLSYTLRITERRLRAFGALGLGLHATADEIKAAHRSFAKTFHPDRVGARNPSDHNRANRVLARLNEARTLLLRPTDEVVLAGDDDIPLGEPRFESEDAETEEYTMAEEDFGELSEGALEGATEDDPRDIDETPRDPPRIEDDPTVLDEVLGLDEASVSMEIDPLDAPEPGQLPPRAFRVRSVTTGR